MVLFAAAHACRRQRRHRVHCHRQRLALAGRGGGICRERIPVERECGQRFRQVTLQRACWSVVNLTALTSSVSAWVLVSMADSSRHSAACLTWGNFIVVCLACIAQGIIDIRSVGFVQGFGTAFPSLSVSLPQAGERCKSSVERYERLSVSYVCVWDLASPALFLPATSPGFQPISSRVSEAPTARSRRSAGQKPQPQVRHQEAQENKGGDQCDLRGVVGF